MKKIVLSLAVATVAVTAQAGQLSDRLENISKDKQIESTTLAVVAGGFEAKTGINLISVVRKLSYDAKRVSNLELRIAKNQAALDAHNKILGTTAEGEAKNLLTEDAKKLEQSIAEDSKTLRSLRQGLITRAAKNGVRIVSGAAGLVLIADAGDKAIIAITTDKDPGLFPVIVAGTKKAEAIADALTK